MDRASHPDRRTVLAGAAAGTLGTIVLAGCGSNDSNKSSPAPASASAGSSGGSSSASGGKTLAALDSIPDGSTVAVDNPDGGKVLLTRNGSAVSALNAKCTHMGCTVAPQGAQLHCPCHGSRFQPGTGAVINGPAASPLAKVNVTVTNGQVTLA